MRLIIDAHLDLAWNALAWKRDITLPLAELNRFEADQTDEIFRGRATVSLPEMRRGGVALCLGTLLVRTPHGGSKGIYSTMLDYPTQEMAYAVVRGQLAYYRELESRGEISIIRNVKELDAHWGLWQKQKVEEADGVVLPVGVILAMEGSDGIVNSGEVDKWFQRGLRCPSLVHYGRSAYAAGTGDDGPLTERGHRILKQFEKAGMILDVTHLSDTSFYDAIDRFSGPLIASHQNCRALVPGQRQFSDEQIKIMVEREGILGTAFDSWMLYPGWVRGKNFRQTTHREKVRMEASADHIDHICQIAGNCRHVAIGSDLDGGFGTEQTPIDLNTIADLQKIEAILSSRGYSEDEIDAIFHGNWLNYFRQHLPKD